MLGRRGVGARTAPGARHAAPRHAARVPHLVLPAGGRRLRTGGGLALVAVGAVAATATAVLLSGTSPAGAEASSTTATLTLTGVRDSNCDVSTGGTTVYVAPGGTVTFKADLAGITVKVPPLGIPVNLGTAGIASFNDKLVIDGHTKTPHYVNDRTSFVWKNVPGGAHSLAWSANSVTLLGGITVPLNADTVLPSSLPVGGKLNWVGSLKATTATKCGISVELPGGGVTVGPVHVTVPPVTSVPTIPVTIPKVPGGGAGGSSAPGGGSGGGGGGGGGNPSSTYTPQGVPIPELVVPNAGSGGDSAFGGAGAGGFGNALPDTGNGLAVPGAKVTSTAPPPTASSPAGKKVELARNSTDSGIGGAQLPVLLAILAILALSLVTAMYARMYLLRRPAE